MSSKIYSRVGAGQLRLGCSGKELMRNLSIQNSKVSRELLSRVKMAEPSHNTGKSRLV